MNGVKKLFLRLGLLALPFTLLGGLVATADPFDYVPSRIVASKEVKYRTSFPLNWVTWKMSRFRQNPREYIILGDSRAFPHDEHAICELTGHEFANMAFGGGTLPEIVDAFWYCVRRAELKGVYIGVNFNLYTVRNRGNRAPASRRMQENPFLYVFNRDSIEGAWLLYGDVLSGESSGVGVPDMSKDQFWKRQLEFAHKYYYTKYQHPEEFRNQLEEIGEYCRANEIELIFVSFPTHIDLQDVATANGLKDEVAQFREDLAAIAPLIDMDYPNETTRNRENFKDPFHYNDEVKEHIFNYLWGGKLDLDELEPGDIIRVDPLAE